MRRSLILLAAAVLAAACSSTPAPDSGGRDEFVLDPATTVPEPDGTSVTPGVWVVDADTDHLVRLDESLGGLARRVTTYDAVLDYAVTADAVWVVTVGERPFLRVPRPAGREEAVPLGTSDLPRQVAVLDDLVWLAGSEVSGVLYRYDPADGTVTGSVEMGDRVDHMTAGENAVWASAGRTLFRIDPSVPAAAGSVGLPFEPSGLETGLGAVWAFGDGFLVRVDPASLDMSPPVRVASPNSDLAVGAGSVWVSDTFRNDIHRVDPVTVEVTATLRPLVKPADIAASEAGVYVVHSGGLRLARLDPADGAFLSGLRSKVSLREVAVG